MLTEYNEIFLKNILLNTHSIAIVGAKDVAGQAVDRVGKYLMQKGYLVVPVHPVRKNVWDLPTYTNIKDIPFCVDMVLVFRASEHCLTHAKESLDMHQRPKTFWMQLGIHSTEAKELLEKESSIQVIEDRCVKIEHEKGKIPSIPQVFDCKQCGDCCYGQGGIVLTQKDIEKLSKSLNMDSEEFKKNYTEIRNEKTSLKSENNSCVFFSKNKNCLVHENKPDVCRAWPYFTGNMQDDVSLDMAKEFCPGIHPKTKHEHFVQKGHQILQQEKLNKAHCKQEPNALLCKCLMIKPFNQKQKPLS